MDIRITPRPLRGTVTPPGSKSMAHRLLLAAALSDGESVVRGVSFSQDIHATLQCIDTMEPMRWMVEGDCVTFRPAASRRAVVKPLLFCGESGSTLRFMIPVALAKYGGAYFWGRGRLMERPLTPYQNLFRRKGISMELKKDVISVQPRKGEPRTHRTRWEDALLVEGKLSPGKYRLPGDVSSQFFTGLLFALPLLDRPSVIESTTPLESAPYVDMTIRALDQAGIFVERSPDGQRFRVPAGKYRPFTAVVEGDWSQAAFWYAADFLNGDITLQGLNPDSVQGDKVILELAERLGRPGEVEISLADCPDLLPPLAVMAAGREGVTRFTRAGRLRLKESDRLETSAALLRAFQVPVEVVEDGMTVSGVKTAVDGTIVVDGANDHRIVMAAAVAASACPGPVVIQGAEAVEKSYPAFWDHYRQLGGTFDTV